MRILETRIVLNVVSEGGLGWVLVIMVVAVLVVVGIVWIVAFDEYLDDVVGLVRL